MLLIAGTAERHNEIGSLEVENSRSKIANESDLSGVELRPIGSHLLPAIRAKSLTSSVSLANPFLAAPFGAQPLAFLGALAPSWV